VPRTPAGFTLVELIVALAVMGISAGLATVAFRSLLAKPDDEPGSWPRQVLEARRGAVLGARPVVLRPVDGLPILFLPDGRAVGEGVDALTGSLEIEP
jgi:prepilin-type N-terminal cleavage/methylation domain-containing protein